MNTKSNGMRLWGVIYPVALYVVVTNIVMFLLNLVWKQTNENYLIFHIITTVIAFPVVRSFYVRPEKEEKGEHRCIRYLFLAGVGAAAAIVLNNLIALTPLIETSGTYREVSAALYGNTIFWEILATGIFTPVIEELLYRGVVYQRLREWLGIVPAVLLSAVLFGAMHMNIVQFVYAGLIGLLLAYVNEVFGLSASITVHAAGNIIGIVRTETGFLAAGGSWVNDWIETILVLLFGIICFLFLLWSKHTK